MGNKAGDGHPKRFGKSAERVAAEQQERRSAANERIDKAQDKIEADDVARHPGEGDYR